MSVTHDTLPPSGSIPDSDTGRSALLSRLLVEAHNHRSALSHNADEIMRIAGVVGNTQVRLGEVHDELRGVRCDLRDLRAEMRDLRAADADITQQVRALPAKPSDPKGIDWPAVAKAAVVVASAIAAGFAGGSALP